MGIQSEINHSNFFYFYRRAFQIDLWRKCFSKKPSSFFMYLPIEELSKLFWQKFNFVDELYRMFIDELFRIFTNKQIKNIQSINKGIQSNENLSIGFFISTEKLFQIGLSLKSIQNFLSKKEL